MKSLMQEVNKANEKINDKIVESKSKQLEYLNTLRFLAVVFILFTHYNYQCFSNYVSNNILGTFIYNKSLSTYCITSGFTGKLALAMMCIISGFLVAKKFKQKEEINFYNFITNRYIRLMSPIFFVGTIYALIKLAMGNSIGITNYLKGVFWPGDISIDDHLYCIGDFLIGNILSALITYYTKEHKYSKVFYIPIIAILYLMNKSWVMVTVMGGLTYEVCIYLKEKNILRYWNLILVIPLIFVLICGEEGYLIYLKYGIASMIFLTYIYCLPVLQKLFNFNKIKMVKKFSYSMFVSHGMVYLLLGQSIINLFRNIIQNDFLLEIITFAVFLIIDIIISGIIYYIAEDKMSKKIYSFITSGDKNTKKVSEKEDEKIKL